MMCAWCGEAFDRPNKKGPAPRYCSASHRQRAYEYRRGEDIERRIRYLEAALREKRGKA